MEVPPPPPPWPQKQPHPYLEPPSAPLPPLRLIVSSLPASPQRVRSAARWSTCPPHPCRQPRLGGAARAPLQRARCPTPCPRSRVRCGGRARFAPSRSRTRTALSCRAPGKAAGRGMWLRVRCKVFCSGEEAADNSVAEDCARGVLAVWAGQRASLVKSSCGGDRAGHVAAGELATDLVTKDCAQGEWGVRGRGRPAGIALTSE